MPTPAPRVGPSAEEFGALVRRLRIAQRLTLAELGERSGLGAEALGQLEVGGREPDLDQILAVGRGLELAVSAMLRMWEAEYGRTMSQADHDCRVDYIEFPSADLERTKAFFTSVFAWTFTDYGPAYSSFADGRVTGGFFSVESVESVESSEGGPLVVLYAIDLERARERVVAHGGRITKDIFAFPGGRRFHFRDPGGNVLAVWSE